MIIVDQTNIKKPPHQTLIEGGGRGMGTISISWILARLTVRIQNSFSARPWVVWAIACVLVLQVYEGQDHKAAVYKDVHAFTVTVGDRWLNSYYYWQGPGSENSTLVKCAFLKSIFSCIAYSIGKIRAHLWKYVLYHVKIKLVPIIFMILWRHF